MKIPFTTDQFFQVIEKYNAGIFPTQILITLLTAAAFMLIFSTKNYKNFLIGSFLGILWIWIGWVYHLSYFTAINPAAHGFGWIFIIQGILTLLETFRKRLLFDFKQNMTNYTGFFLILFGLVIYPLVSYFDGDSWRRTISMGLPCPSTILTFGFFMLTMVKFPKYLLIIPSLWSLLGVSAAMNFGVYQDFMLLIAALIADLVLVRRKSTLSLKTVKTEKHMV
jgi:hypothetical protein